MIPSLIAAGLFPQKAAAISPGTLVQKPDPKSSIFDLFRMRHKYTLAGHSSHSSHSSHASHASHSSSSGGGYSSSTYSAPVYSPPARTYTPPAPVYEAPVAPLQPVYRAPRRPASNGLCRAGSCPRPFRVRPFRRTGGGIGKGHRQRMGASGRIRQQRLGRAFRRRGHRRNQVRERWRLS